jgi:MoaA/NifB/PqqE/SkfB family radical SAM enzyme/polysaccharide pyruvyl transferase WcaK-like protein
VTQNRALERRPAADASGPGLLGAARRSIGANRYVRAATAGGLLVSHTLRQLVRDEWLGQYLPSKPRVIQFPVNDICNSRCVMCNIWQRKRDKEITPDELRQILRDPLFAEVRYVGLSGGEPTLRKDLPELGRVLIEELSKLEGLGIITNALRPETVIERTLALAEVARAGGVSFNVNVSLDGVGDEHDRNRGVPGNFASSVKVIEAIQAAGVSLSIGCTLTPVNCYGADDVLLWCVERGIERREFRLGVDIKRVYNDGFQGRNPFTPEQRFHLTMFFDRLAHDPSVSLTQRRFYRSLTRQLAFGAPRTAGCSWRTRGVTLDTRGNVSYCSVQSPIIGSALERSGWEVFKAGLPERRAIVRDKCGDCMHDLTGPPPARETLRETTETARAIARAEWRRLRKGLSLPEPSFAAPASIRPASKPSPGDWRHVLVTGWYGTETAGDKAILGEVLHFLKSRSPGVRVTLTTLDQKVSQQTNRELADLAGVALVDLARSHDSALIESVDAVVIAGGPLEEINETEHIWRAFREANRQGKARVIFGCGVGPLYTERLREMVGAICQMATAGFLRDEESQAYARRLGATAPLACGCDPALAFVRRWAERAAPNPGAQDGQPVIAGLARANTNEYVVDMGRDELAAFNDRTAAQLAGILGSTARAAGGRVELLPMHSIWFGGDDRIFNRRIARAFEDPALVRVERAYLTLDDLLSRLAGSEAALAMRYHGHLFCMALGVPMLSIDYTGEKGKVWSLIERIGYQRWSEPWRGIDVQRASAALGELVADRATWSAYLRDQTDRALAQLERAYVDVFGRAPVAG